MKNIFDKKPYDKDGIPNLFSDRHDFGYNIGYEAGNVFGQDMRGKVNSFFASVPKALITLFDRQKGL